MHQVLPTARGVQGVVTHPGTKPARWSLTSVIWREPACHRRLAVDIEWRHSCCHGDSFVQFKVVKARQRCKTKIVIVPPWSGISSSNFYNRLPLEYSPRKLAKIVEFWAACACNYWKSVVQKHASNFWRCYGNQGWADAVEIFFLKMSSFTWSESFKAVAEGVLEIFDEVYRGRGGGGGHNVPPLVGIGLSDNLARLFFDIERS